MGDCSKESLIVTVSGRPGSGKTTLAKLLANALGLRYLSSGGLFRRFAEERGVSLAEMSKIAESDYSIDRIVDKIIRDEAVRGGVVVDGHISAWILKDIAHIKVLVMAPLDVRASRIAKRDSLSLNEALELIRVIESSEDRRFRDIYGIDLSDYTAFDLIINTSTFTPEECLSIALEAINKVLNRCS